MISAVIFALHGIAAVLIFIHRRKRAGFGEGLLAVGLFGILFSVGWTIVTMIARFLVPQEGFAEWFDRDSATLSALTVVETAVYLALRPKEKGKGKSGEQSTSA